MIPAPTVANCHIACPCTTLAPSVASVGVFPIYQRLVLPCRRISLSLFILTVYLPYDLRPSLRLHQDKILRYSLLSAA